MADNDTKFEELNTLLDALVNGASTAMAIENIEAWYDANVAELGWNVNVYRIMAAFAERIHQATIQQEEILYFEQTLHSWHRRTGYSYQSDPMGWYGCLTYCKSDFQRNYALSKLADQLRVLNPASLPVCSSDERVIRSSVEDAVHAAATLENACMVLYLLWLRFGDDVAGMYLTRARKIGHLWKKE